MEKTSYNLLDVRAFAEKHCPKGIDSCTVCAHGSGSGECQHPEHPKNKREEKSTCG